jgi:amidase
MVPVAHGNDMGGSIRIPASCCGLVGLKPSRHRTSLFPHGEYWGPLTHEHVLTRSVRDSAAVLDETAGPAPGELHVAPPPAHPWRDDVGADPGRLRVGLVVGRPGGGPVDPECARAARDVAETLDSLGHAVDPAPPDALRHDAAAAFGTIVAAGLAAEVARWEAEFGEAVTDLEPLNEGMVERGRAVTAVEWMAAIDDLARWSNAVVSAYGMFDVLVTPTLPVVPPRIGIMDPVAPTDEMLHTLSAMSAFMVAFDATGQPAISVPTHMSSSGLPIGVQLVGPYAREDLLLRVAGQLERAMPWSDRTAPL